MGEVISGVGGSSHHTNKILSLMLGFCFLWVPGSLGSWVPPGSMGFLFPWVLVFLGPWVPLGSLGSLFSWVFFPWVPGFLGPSSQLGAAGALEMAARAGSEAQWRSKWLLDPATFPSNSFSHNVWSYRYIHPCSTFMLSFDLEGVSR